MTVTRLAIRSLLHYRRTQIPVMCGVASAVAVLAGALLIGGSVQESLTRLGSRRLGHTSLVVAAEAPFGETLGARLAGAMRGRAGAVAPMFVLDGIALHQSSGRRAGHVNVYGVDDRFFAFHGVSVAAPTGSAVLLSPDLAADLGANPGDAVLIRVGRPTDIPVDSLQGRKDDASRSVRLTFRGTLGRDEMGEFSITPSQGPVRAAFVSLPRLQRDLDQPGRVNTLLVAMTPRAAVPPANSNSTAEATDAAGVRAALTSVVEATDLGLRVSLEGAEGEARTVLVEAAGGVIPDATAKAVTDAASSASMQTTPVLTWLATRLTVRDRLVPYSLVTAIGPDAGGDATLARLLSATDPAAPPPIVLNDWTARDSAARTGDALDLEYLRWADEGRLVTGHATFRVAGVVPMTGIAADRRLAPDYPGITDTSSVADWNPPFPIDLKLVRPVDEDYWKRFKATPKAFIRLDDGQRLWRTRHGQVTSLRLRSSTAAAATSSNVAGDVSASAGRVASAAARAVDPLGAGFSIADVGRLGAAASAGTTDFGAYFSYFSFFLVVSALLLTALFFRLGVEQRLSEIGVLRAAGFSLAAVRRLLMIEGTLVAAAGGLLGIALAIGWAALMIYGLRTWWVDAVGTTLLQLHVTAIPLVAGAAGGVLAAVASIAITVRGLGRSTPRQLLSGGRSEEPARRSRRRWIRSGPLALVFLGLAIVLTAASGRFIAPAAGFFGAGASVLVGGLAAFGHWLAQRRTAGSFRDARITSGRVSLGLANAAWRPGRSLTAAGLVAAAVFLLVAVDAFRKTADVTGARDSGTGGFALLAEAALPIAHNPSTIEGRRALGLEAGQQDPALAGVDFVAARLRPGDDASCLNLYRPTRPRVVGVPGTFIDQGRFRFGQSMAISDADRANPWRLLLGTPASGAIPAIVDGTSLEYSLHAAVGDEIVIDQDTGRPVRLLIVAALDDSMLQGEILISEIAFRDAFPDEAGYRLLMVSVTPSTREHVDAVAALVGDRLEPFGVDVENAARRLDAYHRVENTYLSTFQALGGLGLVLGCLGLAAVIARNVLERRREFALLGAAGFTGGDLRVVVIAEQVVVVGAGLITGLAAALVATIPVLASRGGVPSARPLAWVLVVMATGLVTTLAATRSVRRLPLVASLRD